MKLQGWNNVVHDLSEKKKDVSWMKHLNGKKKGKVSVERGKQVEQWQPSEENLKKEVKPHAERWWWGSDYGTWQK